MKTHYSSVIVHQFDPERQQAGGIDTCIRALIRNKPDDEQILIIGTSIDRSLFKVHSLKCEGKDIKFIPVSRLQASASRRFLPHSIRMAVGMMLPLIRNTSPDTTIHVHRTDYLPIVHLFKKSKVVAFIHTNMKAANGSMSDSFWRHFPKLQGHLDATFLQKTQLCVVFNKETAESYKQVAPNVIYSTNWYNEEVFLANDEKTDISALWVGRLEQPKDPILGLQALEAIAAGTANARTVLVGDGSLASNVSAWHTANQCTTDLLGSLPLAEVAAKLRRSEALIMTSHFEGSPIVLFEAMASGTPVIATKAADPDSLIVDGINGFQVPDRRPDSFKQAFERIDEISRKKVAESVRAYSSIQVAGKIWKQIHNAPSARNGGL